MNYAIALLAMIFIGCQLNSANGPALSSRAEAPQDDKEYPVQKSNEAWKEVLTAEEYRILREKGTERAFTGKYDKFYEDGIYVCSGCGYHLFNSDSKFNSGTGWPSFYQPAGDESLDELADYSYGMTRIEVVCGNCGGHLGHVFDDGPKPTGLRYCINSVSLDFVPAPADDEKNNEKNNN